MRRFFTIIFLLVLAVPALGFHYYHVNSPWQTTIYPNANGTTLDWSKSIVDSAYWQSVNGLATEMPADFWYWCASCSTMQDLDTFYVNADGAIPIAWSTSPADSVGYVGVNEVTPNDADYWYYTNLSASYEAYVKFAIDTSQIGDIDSLKLLVRAATTATSDKTYEVKYDLSGDVAFDTLTATAGTVYTTEESKAITGSINKINIVTIEYGAKSIVNVGLGKSLRVSWMALKVFSHHHVSKNVAGAQCFVNFDADTTHVPDSVALNVRLTHTGLNYKQVIVKYMTNGAAINLDTIYARGNQDTIYVVANGDTNQWGGVTSPNYTNVDERIPSSADYVQPNLGSPYSEQYLIETDTAYAATLDSIKILSWWYCPNGVGDSARVEIRTNIGGWTILDTAKVPPSYGTLYKTRRKIVAPTKTQMANLQIGFTKIVNGVNVRLRWCCVERFFSDNIYYTVRTKHPILGLTRKGLDSLQAGVEEMIAPAAGETLKVAQITATVYSHDTLWDYTRRIYHDSSDFVIGQISNMGARDDKWNRQLVQIGRTQTTSTETDSNVVNRAFLVIRNTDSITNNKPGTCPKIYYVDSAFLYLTATAVTGTPNPLQFRQVSPANVYGADTTGKAILPTTGDGDTIFYAHSNWYERYNELSDIHFWLVGGVDSSAEWGGSPFSDTVTIGTGTTAKIDIGPWLQMMAKTDWIGRRHLNGVLLRMEGDNPDSSSPATFYSIANVQPFAGAQSDSSWMEIFTSFVGDTLDPYGEPPHCNSVENILSYAEYPYFGYNDCAGATASLRGAAYLGRFHPDSNGTLLNMAACVRNTSTTSDATLQYGIYTDSVNINTGRLVDYSAQWILAKNTSTAAYVWKPVTVGAQVTNTIGANQRYYWVGVTGKSAAPYIRLIGSVPADSCLYWGTYQGPWANPHTSPAAVFTDNLLSMLVEYVTSSPPPSTIGRRRRLQIQGEAEPDSGQRRTVIIYGSKSVDVPSDKTDSVMVAWGLR